MTRVCFVHAHPDDETIASGALIAHLAGRGHHVSVLTATRGEMGEVVPGPLSHLAGTDALVAHREGELAAALDVLGVSAHAFLGTPPARAAHDARAYRDSGMRWIREGLAGAAEDSDERSFCAADEADAVADTVAWLRHTGTQVVVSYDADGGYGHPDHVRCHDVARAAAAELGLPFAALVHAPGDDVVWFRLEHLLATVVAALRHHASQVSVDGATLTHSGGQSEPVITSVGLKGDLGGLIKEAT